MWWGDKDTGEMSDIGHMVSHGHGCCSSLSVSDLRLRVEPDTVESGAEWSTCLLLTAKDVKINPLLSSSAGTRKSF